MPNIVQNGTRILPEYNLDNLGVSFKVVLINSVECTTTDKGQEIYIPDFQGLIKKIATARAAHPLKLKGCDIRFLRKTLGLKAKELAGILDISPEHLSRCESGEKLLSNSNEKVLRSRILLEAIQVLQKAIIDQNKYIDSFQKKIQSLLDSINRVVSDLKISPVCGADEELVLQFWRAEARAAANDHEVDAAEWRNEAA